MDVLGGERSSEYERRTEMLNEKHVAESRKYESFTNDCESGIIV